MWIEGKTLADSICLSRVSRKSNRWIWGTNRGTSHPIGCCVLRFGSRTPNSPRKRVLFDCCATSGVENGCLMSKNLDAAVCENCYYFHLIHVPLRSVCSLCPRRPF